MFGNNPSITILIYEKLRSKETKKTLKVNSITYLGSGKPLKKLRRIFQSTSRNTNVFKDSFEWMFVYDFTKA